MDVLPAILGWVIWFVATAIVIRADAARQRRLADARGDVDFMDRSVTTYIVLAVFCGPAPLLVYFWSTRKTAAGAFVGMAWALIITLVAAVAMVALAALFPRPPMTFEIPIGDTTIPSLPTAPVAPVDPLAATYVGALREVAASAAPRCAKHPNPPVDNATSPAKGTSLEKDPRVVSLEVWCVMSSGEKVGFASLKELPDARRLSGISPQEKHVSVDPKGGGVLTTFIPSGAVDHANEVRYVSDAGVEVDLDVTP